ncbi:MAG: hypothetical protein H0Z33_16000 [Bacillaceae bacterium]|nr:hypothetical protein [Bacillaceae bacterium]
MENNKLVAIIKNKTLMIIIILILLFLIYLSILPKDLGFKFEFFINDILFFSESDKIKSKIMCKNESPG